MTFDEYYQTLILADLRPDNINKKHFFVLGSEEFLTQMATLRNGDLIESPFIIPFDQKNKNDLFKIDKLTRNTVSESLGIITELNWQCNTIATVVMENIIKKLFDILYETKCGNLELDFYDIFKFCLSAKRYNEAEKEGNINIFFRTNLDLSFQIKNIFDFRNSKYETFYRFIDVTSQADLTNKYGIVISDNWICIAIAHSFIESIFKELVYNIKYCKHQSSFINFNDLIEFFAISDHGKISITARPGMNAKLLVKSDELTEDDYDS